MRLAQYIKSTALALFIPFFTGASAQRYSAENNYKEKITRLTHKAKGYNLWDSRKPINYTVANDSIAYPVIVNYTIDSIQYAGEFSTRANFNEAITLYYLRRCPQAFHSNTNGRLFHEALHFIQNEKMKYLRSRPEYKGVTFEQAYELEMWKETASYIAACIAGRLSGDSIMGLSDIVRMTNRGAQYYLKGQTDSSGYHRQFFNQALKHYNPDVTAQEGYETYMRCKAAIMTQYVNVDGEIKSLNILPLLTDSCYKLINIPNHMMNKYYNNRHTIDHLSRSGDFQLEINDAKKFNLMSKRYGLHKKQEQDEPYPYSCRSDTLSADISSSLPKLHPAHYNQAVYMINAIINNEANNQHQKNQEILATFIRRRNCAIEPELSRKNISGGR